MSSFSHQSESDKEELEDVGVGDGDHSTDQSVADGDGGADDDRRYVVDLKDDLYNNHYSHILCSSYYTFWYWCTIGVPSFLADFEIIPIEAVRGQIYGGDSRISLDR